MKKYQCPHSAGLSQACSTTEHYTADCDPIEDWAEYPCFMAVAMAALSDVLRQLKAFAVLDFRHSMSPKMAPPVLLIASLIYFRHLCSILRCVDTTLELTKNESGSLGPCSFS